MRDDSEGFDPCNLGEGTILSSTAKAVCVRLNNGKKELWIPRSCLHDDSEVFGSTHGTSGKEGKVIVMTWWARKEGLEP